MPWSCWTSPWGLWRALQLRGSSAHALWSCLMGTLVSEVGSATVRMAGEGRPWKREKAARGCPERLRADDARVSEGRRKEAPPHPPGALTGHSGLRSPSCAPPRGPSDLCLSTLPWLRITVTFILMTTAAESFSSPDGLLPRWREGIHCRGGWPEDVGWGALSDPRVPCAPTGTGAGASLPVPVTVFPAPQPGALRPHGPLQKEQGWRSLHTF